MVLSLKYNGFLVLVHSQEQNHAVLKLDGGGVIVAHSAIHQRHKLTGRMLAEALVPNIECSLQDHGNC